MPAAMMIEPMSLRAAMRHYAGRARVSGVRFH